MKILALVLCNAAIYVSFDIWSNNTVTGLWVRDYLQNWKADGWVHGIMCSVSVFLLFCAAILAVGLGFRAIGL